MNRQSSAPTLISRRAVLQVAGGFAIATALPVKARAQSGAAAAIQGGGAPGAFAPNAFIRVAADDTITVLVKHIEFGQGPWTGLATLVAEEMDAAWSQMRAEHSPSNVQLYANAAFGIQGTGGSTAIANSFMQMRKAGAAARAMLVAAAAKTWGVAPEGVTVSDGVVRHAASGRTASFGALAELAAAETPPADPPVKARDDFKLVGKSLPKLDTASKTDGSAVFTLDVYRENMLTAVVAHPPKFGATPASYDADAAKAVPGVVDVQEIPSGVAVYAETTYAALKGRAALGVDWDDSAAETRSTASLVETFRAATASPGLIASESGETDAMEAALADPGDGATLEAEYIFPYLAHAPMEPLDAVIEQSGDTVEAWLGSQLQTVDHQTIAGVLGVDPANVQVNTMLAGGSFGRRAQPTSRLAAAAAHAFAAAGRARPVKLMWTREDDIRGGYYRPLTAHRLRGAIGPDGVLTAWDQTIASQSILKGTPFEAGIVDGVDGSMVEGARNLYYDPPHSRVSVHTMDVGVPVLWWRSVGHTHTAYAVETFVDQLIEAVGADPVSARLAMTINRPRLAGVLTRAAEIADWGRAPRGGAAFGVAIHPSFESYVAEIAEVSIENGAPRVHHVWAAIDCGQPVNVNVIEAQIEGGIGYGLGAALMNEINLDEGGAVRESNFHDYRSLRIDQMPAIDVAVIDSAEAPKGVGEPGVPPIAPAVANAVRRLTGETPTLPMFGASV